MDGERGTKETETDGLGGEDKQLVVDRSQDASKAHEAELYFLVLHFLSGGPCQSSVRQLEQEAVSKGLLPKRYDFTGQQHQMTYEDLKSRYDHIKPEALCEMMGMLLEQKRQHVQEGAAGLSSLLGSGRLSILPGAVSDTTPLSYMRPPAQHTLLPHSLMLRELGIKPPAKVHSYTMARHFRHQHTSRGHRQVVYCLTYDRSGTKVITGSDDYLVKIWSIQTAALLKTCRGHDAEIMDFAVSYDNTMVASASADRSIRVWNLQTAKLGHPVSVLLGHEKGVTYLDFNRKVKHALVSTSYDGTCCIWNALDDKAPPIVLRPTPQFGQPFHMNPAGNMASAPVGHAAAMGENRTSTTAATDPSSDTGLKCCSFSPCGTFLVAGGTECISFIWAWDIIPDTSQPKRRTPPTLPTLPTLSTPLTGVPTKVGTGTGAGSNKTAPSGAPMRPPMTGRSNGLVGGVGQVSAVSALGGLGPPNSVQGGRNTMGIAEVLRGNSMTTANMAMGGNAMMGTNNVMGSNGMIGANNVMCGDAMMGTNNVMGANAMMGTNNAMGTNNRMGANNAVGTYNYMGASNVRGTNGVLGPTMTGTNNMAGVNNMVGTNNMMGAARMPGTSNMVGAHSTPGANHLSGANSVPGMNNVLPVHSMLGMSSTPGVNNNASSAPITATSAPITATAAPITATSNQSTPLVSPVGTLGANNAAASAPMAAISHHSTSLASPVGAPSTATPSVMLGAGGGTAVNGVSVSTGSAVNGNGPSAWPRPRELAKLCGHKNDIILTQFSNNGHMLATASNDGSVRIWAQQKRRGRYLRWWSDKPKHILACPALPSTGRNRQRRRVFTNPQVNQVAWTCDDVKVLATVSDNSLRVWCSETGQRLHCLQGHTLQAHVLECHPTDCRMALTAGYDGQVIIWDIELGLILRRFSTKDTCPCPYPWTDAIQVTDGHFSPDGCGFSVSDAAGQLHIYGYGENPFMANTPYDQFLSADYNMLQRDVRGYTIDLDTQQPPHLMTDTQQLCDYLMDPYCEEIQLAYRSGQIQSAPPVTIAQGEVLPHALLLLPPTSAAAGWLASEEGRSDRAYIDRALERHRNHMQAIAKGEAAEKKADGPPNVFPTPQAESPSPAQVNAAAPQRRLPQPRPDTIDLATTTRSTPYTTAPGLASPQMTSPDFSQQRRRPAAYVDLFSCSDDSGDADAVVSDDGDDSDNISVGSLEEEDDEEEGAGRGARGVVLRSRREVAGKRSQSAGAKRAPQHSRPMRQPKRSRFNEDEFVLDSDSFDSFDSDLGGSAEEDAEDASRRPKRRAAARHAKPWMEGLSSSHTRRNHKASKKSKQDDHRRAMRRLSDAGYQRGRDPAKYQWLQVSQQSPACYIPQMGDDVVYLRDGHEEHMSKTRNKLALLPYQLLARQYPGKQMRQAEPCRVEQLEYCITDDGNDNTVARLKLRITDQEAPLYGCDFEVELPHPSLALPDFVIHKALYDFGVKKHWSRGEKCKSFSMHEDGVTGEWWYAAVVDDVLSFPTTGRIHPYSSGQWRRFKLRWRESDEVDDDGVSAWEIFAEYVELLQIRKKMPEIPGPIRTALQQAVETMRAHERFEDVAAVPDHNVSIGGLPYTAFISLPLSLEEVHKRLQDNFYRSLEAMKHDLQHILSNAVATVGDEGELAVTAKEMVEYLGMVMDGKPLPALDGAPRRHRTHASSFHPYPSRSAFLPPSNGAGPSRSPGAPATIAGRKLAIKVKRPLTNLPTSSAAAAADAAPAAVPHASAATQLPSTSVRFPTAQQPSSSAQGGPMSRSPPGSLRLKLPPSLQPSTAAVETSGRTQSPAGGLRLKLPQASRSSGALGKRPDRGLNLVPLAGPSGVQRTSQAAVLGLNTQVQGSQQPANRRGDDADLDQKQGVANQRGVHTGNIGIQVPVASQAQRASGSAAAGTLASLPAGTSAGTGAGTSAGTGTGTVSNTHGNAATVPREGISLSHHANPPLNPGTGQGTEPTERHPGDSSPPGLSNGPAGRNGKHDTAQLSEGWKTVSGANEQYEHIAPGKGDMGPWDSNRDEGSPCGIKRSKQAHLGGAEQGSGGLDVENNDDGQRDHDEHGHDQHDHDQHGHDQHGHDEQDHDERGHDQQDHDERDHDERDHDERDRDERDHDEQDHDEQDHGEQNDDDEDDDEQDDPLRSGGGGGRRGSNSKSSVQKQGRRTAAKQARFGKAAHAAALSSDAEDAYTDGDVLSDVDDDGEPDAGERVSSEDGWDEEDDEFDEDESSDGSRRRKKGGRKAKAVAAGGRKRKRGSSGRGKAKQKRAVQNSAPLKSLGVKAPGVGVIMINQWGRRNFLESESEEEQGQVDEGSSDGDSDDAPAKRARVGVGRASGRKEGNVTLESGPAIRASRTVSGRKSRRSVQAEDEAEEDDDVFEEEGHEPAPHGVVPARVRPARQSRGRSRGYVDAEEGSKEADGQLGQGRHSNDAAAESVRPGRRSRRKNRKYASGDEGDYDGDGVEDVGTAERDDVLPRSARPVRQSRGRNSRYTSVEQEEDDDDEYDDAVPRPVFDHALPANARPIRQSRGKHKRYSPSKEDEDAEHVQVDTGQVRRSGRSRKAVAYEELEGDAVDASSPSRKAPLMPHRSSEEEEDGGDDFREEEEEYSSDEKPSRKGKARMRSVESLLQEPSHGTRLSTQQTRSTRHSRAGHSAAAGAKHSGMDAEETGDVHFSHSGRMIRQNVKYKRDEEDEGWTGGTQRVSGRKPVGRASGRQEGVATAEQTPTGNQAWAGRTRGKTSLYALYDLSSTDEEEVERSHRKTKGRRR